MTERELDGVADDSVLLVDGDGLVATSPLVALEECILFVNPDIYISGSRSVTELQMPAVLDGLGDTPQRLRGYPESHKEKLLLITISRWIEARAPSAGAGTISTSFKDLSRIEDDRGTRDVYAVLDTALDVHVYGRPDWRPDPTFPATMHAGFGDDFRKARFVIYTASHPDATDAALLAIETAPADWRGFWTDRRDVIADLNRYVETRL